MFKTNSEKKKLETVLIFLFLFITIKLEQEIKISQTYPEFAFLQSGTPRPGIIKKSIQYPKKLSKWLPPNKQEDAKQR